MPKHWFAVHTKPNSEKIAFAGTAELDIDAIFPRFSREIHHARSFEVVTRALFPQYFFARFDREEKVSRWPEINRMRGVLGILGDTLGTPIPIPMTPPFEELLASCDPKTGIVRQPPPAERKRFKRGEKVAIIDGPLASLEGLCQMDDGERVLLLLDKLFAGVKTFAPSEFCIAASSSP